jgi:hypothetical protein
MFQRKKRTLMLKKSRKNPEKRGGREKKPGKYPLFYNGLFKKERGRPAKIVCNDQTEFFICIKHKIDNLFYDYINNIIIDLCNTTMSKHPVFRIKETARSPDKPIKHRLGQIVSMREEDRFYIQIQADGHEPFPVGQLGVIYSAPETPTKEKPFKPFFVNF